MGNGTQGGGTGGGGGGNVVSGGIKLTKKALASVQNLEKLLEQERSTYTVTGFGAFTGYAEIIEARMKSVESSLRTISAAGLTFAKGGKINVALNSVSTIMDKLAGNAQLGADAIIALSKNMETFPMLAKSSTEFAESIGLQAASLDRLGISFQQYTKNVEMGMNMFNMSETQILKLNQGLKDFADEMKMLPSVVSQNFQMVAKSLSYEGPKVAEQFKKMQTLSQQTGVSVGTLMSGFGERLDTMSGAAQFVGQLNAILGTNAFSPNEILMMDESERMVRIREVIRKHPIYSDIQAGGKLGKFALNTMSKVIGYSKEDTRKYLTGNIDGGTFKPNEANSAKSKAASAVGQAAATSDGLVGVLKQAFEETKSSQQADRTKFVESIERNTEILKNLYLSSEDRAMAGERGRIIGAPLASGTLRSFGGDVFQQLAAKPRDNKLRNLASALISGQTFQNLGRFGQGGLGDMVEDINNAKGFTGQMALAGKGERLEATNIALVRLPQLIRLFENLSTLPDNNNSRALRQKMGQLISKVGDPSANLKPSDIKDVEDSMAALLKESATLADPFRKGDGEVDREEAQLLAIARKATGTNALGIYKSLLRAARAEDNGADKIRERMTKLANDPDSGFKLPEGTESITGIDQTNAQSVPLETQDDSKSPARQPAQKSGRLQLRSPRKDASDDSGASLPATGGLSAQGIANLVNTLSASGGLKFLFKVGDGTAKEIAATAFAGEGLT